MVEKLKKVENGSLIKLYWCYQFCKHQNQTGWELYVGPCQKYNSTYIDPLRKLESEIRKHKRTDVPCENWCSENRHWTLLSHRAKLHRGFYVKQQNLEPVTVAEQFKACTVFGRSEAGIVGSNPTQGIDVWYVYVFILSVFR
jgi:hypothetical protein